MSEPEYTYSAGNHPDYHAADNHFQFPARQRIYGRTWSLVVTDLADDYHANHDGWEASWPMEFRIYEDGAEVARFDVDRESQPVFYANALAIPDPVNP